MKLITLSIALLSLTACSEQVPDVYVSWSNSSCVKVVNYDSNNDYTCGNLPELYTQINVK